MKTLLAIALALFMSTAFAGKPHSTTTYTDNSTTTTNNYYYDGDGGDVSPQTASLDDGDSIKQLDRVLSAGVAASLAAAGCTFDYAPGFQGCFSIGSWDNEYAWNFQAAKRVDVLLLQGGVQCDTDFNDCGYLVGGSWHF